jgi:hypothetical protein
VAWGFAYGALTPCGGPFQILPLPLAHPLSLGVLQPQGPWPLVWALPRSLAATDGISSLDFFSSGY